jgi:hypothetical protein
MTAVTVLIRTFIDFLFFMQRRGRGNKITILTAQGFPQEFSIERVFALKPSRPLALIAP